MRRLAVLAAMVQMTTACAAGHSAATTQPSPGALTSPAPSPSPSPSPSSSPTAAAVGTPGPTPSPTLPPAPIIACKAGADAGALVLLGAGSSASLLYQVSDPVHPKLLCRITGTSAHTTSGGSLEYLKPVSATETDLVLRSLSNGNESTLANLPFAAAQGSWLPDGSVMAYTALPTDNNGGSPVQVLLYAQHAAAPLYAYPYPLTDCICRFGLPEPTAALSPDGQYLLSGWPIGKGAAPLVVFRLSDHSKVQSLDITVVSALWDRSGHRLLLVGLSSVQSWTPESGIQNLAGAKQWSYLPGLSPDGSQVAYTAYADAQMQQLRVYLYDMKAGTTRTLTDQPRSQVAFVKSGWVWYLQEASCDPNQCGPWGSAPTGKVYAMELSTGRESEVSFASGDAPLSAGNWSNFGPGDFWPAS